MNMMTYISIGLGALILIMATLFILFVIQARGRLEVENVRPGEGGKTLSPTPTPPTTALSCDVRELTPTTLVV